MYTANQIADFFIDITKDDPNSEMTNMRLNKLLYIAQVYYLYQTGTKLFSDDIEIWECGPVIHDAYYKYHMYKDGVIRKVSDDFDENLFDDGTADFLIGIEVDTSKYSTSYLGLLSNLKGNSKRRLISISDMIADYDNLVKKIDHFDLREAVRKLPKYKTYQDPDGTLVVVR